MHRTLSRCLRLICTCFFTAGCGLPILDLHDAVDLHRTSFRDKVAVNSRLAEDFLICTNKAYDERGTHSASTERLDSRPPTEPSARGVIQTDRQLDPVRALIEREKAKRQDQGESLSAVEDLLQDLKDRSRQSLDLNKLMKVIEVIRRWHIHLAFDEDDLSRDASRFAQLLLAYNKAYFGDVHFAAEPSASGAGIRAVTKVTSSGFTDRNGNTWVFPGLSLSLTAEPRQPVALGITPVDSQRISADLVRVFLEAFFDTAFREPAVQEATALRVEWKDSARPYPAFDADHPPIPLEAFARVTRDALRAEAAATSLVGKAVRGGSVFSIQNETVAATLETAAGVIAKKLVEHEGFCYYQILDDQPIGENQTSPNQGMR